MGKTKIEWTENNLNIVTGCLNDCEYCYAKRMCNRLRGRYGYDKDDPFKPTIHRNKIKEPYKRKKPTMWFVSTMGELFGPWVPRSWVLETLKVIKDNPHHTFQLLTKCPKTMKTFNYALSKLPNAWLGVSCDSQRMVGNIDVLKEINGNNIKFVSFEPLLGRIEHELEGLDWVIIGARTQPLRLPKREWVLQLVREAKQHDIPVFMKNNLESLFSDFKLIQEWPHYRGVMDWKY